MKAVVFDMDGVIFDTERAVIEVWKEVADKHGIPDIVDFCTDCIGINAVATKQKFIEHYGDKYSYDDIRAEKTGIIRDRFRKGTIDIKEGAEFILKSLKDHGFKIALASSTREEAVREELTLMNLISYFDEIVTGDMVERSKPEPDIFIKACEKLGVAPSETFGIEDSFNGIRSCHEAGLVTIMVPDLLMPTDEIRDLSDIVCKDLYDAFDYIMKRSVKFIAVDLDGTLLDSDKNCPPEFFSFVKNHPEIIVALSSGRQYYCLKKQFEEISDRLLFVAENGAVVFYKDEIIYKNIMAPSAVEEALKMARTLPGNAPIACGINSAYMNPVEEEVAKEPLKYYDHFKFVDDLEYYAANDEVMKVAVFIREKKAQEVYENLPTPPQGTAAVLSGDSWIDISNSDTDKGNSISFVLDKFGIKPSEAMAFGDYLNDISMLKVCEQSFAMKNALDEVKATARFVTNHTNDDHGVTQTLKSIFGD